MFFSRYFEMFHRRVILSFSQQDSEPLSNAWERFQGLLCRFAMHGFSKDCQLEIFINGLRNATRSWVERGDGITSFYQQSIDEAYWMMEDMVEYDKWKRSHLMNNYGWENDASMRGPWIDIEREKVLEEAIGRLASVTNQFMLETKVNLQLQQMAMTRLGLQIDNLIAKSMVDAKENNVEDSTSMEENLEKLQQECAKEGTNPEIVEPMLCREGDGPLWPTYLAPTRKVILQSQDQQEKESHVESMSYKCNYPANLEGKSTQEPWVVLYDTYYGRKPLFDEHVPNNSTALSERRRLIGRRANHA